MSNFRKRICLVHELRQLRRTKELTHRSRDRLGVDEIARHRRLHLLMDRHLFLDRALHSLQADAKLILEQFADGPHATIAQVIDIVSLINRPLLIINGIPAHLQNVGDDFKKVARLKQRIFDPIHFRLAHLDIEFQAADAREIEFARIEEHAFEQAIGSLHRRRIARTHLAINLE